MSKKKNNKDIDNMLCQVVNQCILEKGGIRNKLTDNITGMDYAQQVEQRERLHEEEDNFCSTDAIMKLAWILKDNQQDLQLIRELVKEVQCLSEAHNSSDHDNKKRQKKFSKQTDELQKQLKALQLEVKKCHKQLKEQDKTLRILAVYLDLGTMSDDLIKIQKRCSKKMNLQRGNTYYLPNRRQPVIDAEYWEEK